MREFLGRGTGRGMKIEGHKEENSEDSQRVFVEYSAVNWSVHAYEETGESKERIRANSAWCA